MTISKDSTEVRFWSKVDKGGECWLWTGYRLPSGYGQFTIQRFIKLRAHRFSYELGYGRIPDGLHVCHRCDNPPCVRPDHLFLGTDADNLHDMEQKGRRAATHGEQNGNCKLSFSEVVSMRQMYAGGGVSYLALAQRFGVSQTQVKDIILRRKWANAP